MKRNFIVRGFERILLLRAVFIQADFISDGARRALRCLMRMRAAGKSTARSNGLRRRSPSIESLTNCTLVDAPAHSTREGRKEGRKGRGAVKRFRRLHASEAKVC